LAAAAFQAAGCGISTETAETFGVGLFSGKGSMSGRCVVPIHNEASELLAYAGRSIANTEPRYKLPAGFHKSLKLYNLHRVIATGQRGLIVLLLKTVILSSQATRPG
jgi:hypothetical protein